MGGPKWPNGEGDSRGEIPTREIPTREIPPCEIPTPEIPRREIPPREIDEWMYEFMARLAHDLRTPLGAIRMWSHVLRSGKESDRPEALDAIEASARSQSETIAFLVDVARAVAGRLPIEKCDCDLRSIVRAAVDANAEEARGRDVTVTLEMVARGEEEFSLAADPTRLREAVECLVGAAIGVTPRQQVVSVRLMRARGIATVVVRAPRAGVPMAVVRDLFTPYRPGRTDLGDPRRDFGLGPVFARCVMRLHGGDVDANVEDDEVGAGALVFTALLPLAPAIAPAPAT